MIDEKIAEKIGEFWDRRNKSNLSKKIIRLAIEFLKERRLPVRGWLTSVLRSLCRKNGWWNNPFIVMKVNEIVCGQQLEGRDQGLIFLLKKRYSNLLPLSKGVSVGCGNASKEILLLQNGIAEHFDLFELSKKRIAEGIKHAEKVGLSERMNFIYGDAFEIVKNKDLYDLVVWCDSLHHMPDVDKALHWSRYILRKGGMLYLSDYVGPNRLQWTERTLKMAKKIRRILDPRFLIERNQPFYYPPAEINAPNIEELVVRDPSEAWDSERIIPSIEKHFPEAEIYPMGGVVYFAALNNCIRNFHPKKDRGILEFLMLKDKMFMKAGETLYAAALGCKHE